MKDFWRDVIIDVIGGVAVLVAFTLLGFLVGYDKGQEKGYTAALDDARLGKPAKYKLVQTAEKWVEVEK
ncbi:MAG: hypothetical protein J6W00_14940 [Lentisphaeria bacterium]|nr:hypothetical protein [Lentisphaeria bacterium]